MGGAAIKPVTALVILSTAGIVIKLTTILATLSIAKTVTKLAIPLATSSIVEIAIKLATILATLFKVTINIYGTLLVDRSTNVTRQKRGVHKIINIAEPAAARDAHFIRAPEPERILCEVKMKNPITALSDLFSKLVIEHGSAVIQEKQIALFRDELAILGRKLTESDSRIEKLEMENQNLKTDNEQLKKKIQISSIPSHNNLLQEFTFVDPPGYYTHPKYSYPICPACLINKGQISPVSKVDENAWYCNVCNEPMSGSRGEVFTIPD
jgi:hypothetical protein